MPYSLTEEFSIVYRMHPLIPDDYEIRDWQTDKVEDRYTLRQLSGVAGKAVLAEADLVNLFYTFGTSHPGAIVLQNFPTQLQEFQRPDGRCTDLAATNIFVPASSAYPDTTSSADCCTSNRRTTSPT